MAHTEDSEHAVPVPVVVPTLCWWVDRGDCWEHSHHATREDAVAAHVAQVRADDGRPDLTEVAAFALVPGVVRQEKLRCWRVRCPECGREWHIQDRFDSCGDCGYDLTDADGHVEPADPHQTRLFEALPTHDLPGQSLGQVVIFTEQDSSQGE